ncbi:MAG: HEAT repeat domain-containing protein [Cyanobacteria bacterium P01_A01_bin.123]
MAKSRKLESLQASINAVRHQLAPATDEAIATLRSVLASKQPIAIAQIAKLVNQYHLTELIPLLAHEFERMLIKGASTDPSCIAKKAIANTLYRLEYAETELFLNGIHHRQREPVWGTTVDTAPGLRAICALALVRVHYREIMVELADLLADTEVEARIGAARAIAYSENPQGIPLLRLKVHLGDEEPQVLSECFMALLKMAPQQSFPLVAPFLEGFEPAICELAALALGEARIPEAFAAIKRAWQRAHESELRQNLLLAIATLRTDDAIQFLTGLIERGNLEDAKGAIAALRIYRDIDEIWQQVEATTRLRGDGTLVNKLK